MRKEITFNSTYVDNDGKAVSWLSDLSKCFEIKNAKIRSYVIKTKYTTRKCCKLIVEFE